MQNHNHINICIYIYIVILLYTLYVLNVVAPVMLYAFYLSSSFFGSWEPNDLIVCVIHVYERRHIVYSKYEILHIWPLPNLLANIIRESQELQKIYLVMLPELLFLFHSTALYVLNWLNTRINFSFPFCIFGLCLCSGNPLLHTMLLFLSRATLRKVAKTYAIFFSFSLFESTEWKIDCGDANERDRPEKI